MEAIRLKDCDPTFIYEVIEAGGENAQLCFECGTCTGGCPVAYAMDYTPRQILRMVELGMRDEVLQSGTIWTCAACQTCTTRCPRGVGISYVMGALKSIAIRNRVPPKNPKGPAFYTSFAEVAEKEGRVHEAMLMLKFVFKMEFLPEYKLSWKNVLNPIHIVAAVRDLMKDAPLGLKLLKKGKLELIPKKIKGVDQVHRIFENVSGMKKEGER